MLVVQAVFLIVGLLVIGLAVRDLPQCRYSYDFLGKTAGKFIAAAALFFAVPIMGAL